MAVAKPTYSIDAPDQARLKQARAEIEAILQKHDLGGVMMLHTPGMGEFFYRVNPSYSCAWIDEQAGALRIRSKLAEYDGDKARQLHDLAATANLFASLADMSANASMMFRSCQQHVDRAVKAEHFEPRLVRDPNEAKRH